MDIKLLILDVKGLLVANVCCLQGVHLCVGSNGSSVKVPSMVVDMKNISNRMNVGIILAKIQSQAKRGERPSARSGVRIKVTPVEKGPTL